MKLKITRRTIKNGNIIKTFKPKFVDCNQLDLDFIILPALKKMVAINNAHYKLMTGNNESEYVIEPVDIMSADEFKNYSDKYVNDGIDVYNGFIDIFNIINKRSNSRPLLKSIKSVTTDYVSVIPTKTGGILIS